MSKRSIVLSTFFALTLVLATSVEAAAKNDAESASIMLTLGSAFRAPYINPPDDGLVWRIITGLETQPSIKFRFSDLPAARSLALANNGVIDGDIIRIRDINREFQNLVRVEVPICTIEISAFSWTPNVTVGSFAALADMDDLVLSTQIGRKLIQSKLEAAPNRLFVESVQRLFVLLEQKRSDIVVLDRPTAYWIIGKRLKRSIYEVADTPLAQQDYYLYLHKKHAALVPALEQALAAKLDRKPPVFQRHHP